MGFAGYCFLGSSLTTSSVVPKVLDALMHDTPEPSIKRTLLLAMAALALGTVCAASSNLDDAAAGLEHWALSL